jgi:hypothetical protein
MPPRCSLRSRLALRGVRPISRKGLSHDGRGRSLDFIMPRKVESNSFVSRYASPIIDRFQRNLTLSISGGAQRRPLHAER